MGAQSAFVEERWLESAGGDGKYIPFCNFKPPFDEDFNPFRKEGV